MTQLVLRFQRNVNASEAAEHHTSNSVAPSICNGLHELLNSASTVHYSPKGERPHFVYDVDIKQQGSPENIAMRPVSPWWTLCLESQDGLVDMYRRIAQQASFDPPVSSQPSPITVGINGLCPVQRSRFEPS